MHYRVATVTANSSKYVYTAQGEFARVRPKLIWELVKGLFWEVTFQLRLRVCRSQPGARGRGGSVPGPVCTLGTCGVARARDMQKGWL